MSWVFSIHSLLSYYEFLVPSWDLVDTHYSIYSSTRPTLGTLDVETLSIEVVVSMSDERDDRDKQISRRSLSSGT